MFQENAVKYLRNGKCKSFQTFATVFSTPENLLVAITGGLGTKESHFLSKNVFWENAVEYLRNSEYKSFLTFAIVFSTPENLLVGITGILGMTESHFLMKTVFWENAVGYLRNSECKSFQTFAIVFSTPENLLVQISGALRTKENHFSKLKHVLRKCSGVSQKQWMIELSNLCHCLQHPWKFTTRYFWSSRNKINHFLSWDLFSENAVEHLRNGEW